MEKTIKQISDYFKTDLKEVFEPLELEQIKNLAFNFVLKLDRLKILAYPETKISNSDYNHLLEVIKRLKKNEPIQYIMGETEFFDLRFKVAPAVLIPRPETEELVHWIIEDHKNQQPAVLDIGTGSGCIAISLNKFIMDSKVSAIDISNKALEIAQENNSINKTEVNFLEIDILNCKVDDLPSPIDVLVSNPPYVKEEEKALMNRNVLDYEPHQALFVSNDNPLIFYQKIAEWGVQILVPNGKLYFEINENLSVETTAMLKELGYQNIVAKEDLNGKYRMIRADR